MNSNTTIDLIAGDTRNQSSPTQTFPIDAVAISGSFETGFFIPDVLDGTADVIDHPTTNVPPWVSSRIT
jgi:hypothetical protein